MYFFELRFFYSGPFLLCFTSRLSYFGFDQRNDTCRARFLGYCPKRRLVPTELITLFGHVSPSPSHVKRICKILKSKLWRQIRLLYDFLIVLAYRTDPELIGEARLRALQSHTAQAVGFW